MGQAFWVQPTNNAVTFTCMGTYSGCMSQMSNLSQINVGDGGSVNNQYVEMVNSGECFFLESWFMLFYAAPGTAQGEANFGIGLSSAMFYTLSPPEAPWVMTQQSWGHYTAYLFTLPGGYVLGNFGLGTGSGGTGIFSYSIAAPSGNAASANMPPPPPPI